MIYDAIVVGTGGIGSAALYHLARRGAQVLGLDRYPPGHDHGSSHGHTRIIRQAYFEHPDYVPLLRRAYELWEELQQTVSQQLFFPVGVLQAGRPDGGVVAGVLKAARAHNLAVEPLSPQEVAQRYPAYALPDDATAVFERDAGYLLVTECIEAHIRLARDSGAELKTGVSVRGFNEDAHGTITVDTDVGHYTARKVIVSAGAWAPVLLDSAALDLHVLRKQVYWYHCDPGSFAPATYPVCLFELSYGTFYALPRIDGRGIKVANHTGGDLVDNPDQLSRRPDRADRKLVERFVREHLGLTSPELAQREVCMYTMSADGHFVIGDHPQLSNVYFIAGLSGHGFKFAPVLGEIMAQQALDGGSLLAVDFLHPRRFRQSPGPIAGT